MKVIFAVFTTVLAILAWNHPAAGQQQEKVRRIGFLSVFSQSHSGSQRWHQAFLEGLRDLGWIAGKNIAI